MNPETVSDDEFLAGMEATTWPGERVGHGERVWLGWLYLRRHGPREGDARLQRTILRYATSLGAASKCHGTVRRAWSAHVYGAMRETPGLESFEAFMEAHPELLNGRL